MASRKGAAIPAGSAKGSAGLVQTIPSASSSGTRLTSRGLSRIFGGSKKGSSRGCPMNQTLCPTTPRNIAVRALSPEEAIASQQSAGTPKPSSWISTSARERGELVTSTTTPPPLR